MPENLKVRGHAWYGKAEREREQAACGGGMVVRVYECVCLPVDPLERICWSTLKTAT